MYIHHKSTYQNTSANYRNLCNLKFTLLTCEYWLLFVWGASIKHPLPQPFFSWGSTEASCHVGRDAGFLVGWKNGGVPGPKVGPNFSDIVIFRRFSGTFSADSCGRCIFKLMGKSFSTNIIKSLSTDIIYNESLQVKDLVKLGLLSQK